jgi:hypothetical protein
MRSTTLPAPLAQEGKHYSLPLVKIRRRQPRGCFGGFKRASAKIQIPVIKGK